MHRLPGYDTHALCTTGRVCAMARDSGVEDARPPLALIRVMNPVLRVLLRTSIGRAIRPFALLTFNGQRTGRRYHVPVGWHTDSLGMPFVLTPAPWRNNFTGGRMATVHHRGRASSMHGTLETSPHVVANELNAMVDSGLSLRMVGIRVPSGHRLEAEDVTALDRQAIRFEPTPAEPRVGEA